MMENKKISRKLNRIRKDKVLYRKIVYAKHCEHYDDFGDSSDIHKFEYDITISKCYTLSGMVWEIKMPNCTDHDKNLYRLIVRSIEYAASEFPQRFRLVDELYKKELFKKL